MCVNVTIRNSHFVEDVYIALQLIKIIKLNVLISI